MLTCNHWVHVDAEYDRLREESLEFTQEPTTTGDTRMAVFDDTFDPLHLVLQ